MDAAEKIATLHQRADSSSHMYMSFAYTPSLDIMMATSFMVHNKPIVKPASLSPLNDLKKVYTTNRITNISSMADEIMSWNTPNLQQFYRTITIRANAPLLLEIMDIFLQEVECLSRVPGILPNFVLNPIDQVGEAGRLKNGGSPIDVSAKDGPLFREFHLNNSF